MNEDKLLELKHRLDEATKELESAKTDVDNHFNRLLGCGLLVSVTFGIVIILPIVVILWKWALVK